MTVRPPAGPRSRPLHGPIAAAVLAVAVGLAGCTGPVSTTPRPTAVPTSATPDGTSLPPWPAPDDVAERVAAAGLDLGQMGTAEHYHPTLQILIRGQQVPVAANIGVDVTSGAMSALHTHEPDGTIHIEADTIGQPFTLGQLFSQWGVKLSTNQIGGVQAASGRKVKVTSNGTVVPGDPSDLRLQPDQRIVLQLP